MENRTLPTAQQRGEIIFNYLAEVGRYYVWQRETGPPQTLVNYRDAPSKLEL